MSNFNARFPPKPVNKRSVFERQRAEAEAKRQRDNAETAAIYEDFVKSFDDGDEKPAQQQQQQQPPPKTGITIGSIGGRRHFSMPSATGTPQRNSGPGSLGPVSFGSTDRRKDLKEPRRAFNDSDSDEEGQVQERTPRARKSAASTKTDRAEERAAAKPTIRLANMPPGTSPAAARALVANNSSLVVEGVQILPLPTNQPTNQPTDRKALAAIVTLAAETPASDIDAAVSALQNHYLGFGYYLSLHRHLSSAVASTTNMQTSANAATAQPFGAKPVPSAPKDSSTSTPGTAFAPPPSYSAGPRFAPNYHGRVPPPPSYSTSNIPTNTSTDGILHVPVKPPTDIKKLRMIHKVVESILSQGPAFEALLMSRPEVQRQEKWAWIWDARSEAGVWYRYRLWQTVTGLGKRQKGKYMPVFEGSHAWKMPDRPLPYEFDTSLAELVSDSEYNSEDDSDEEDKEDKDDKDETFLNPLEKARLVHLLARLPTTMARLRKGDVARITAFAMTHASRGADEVVDTIVQNVEHPFFFRTSPKEKEKEKEKTTDVSAAQLVAVYVVSDILSSSATSGVRHAWRFRQLFEAALRRRNVFAGLGLLAERHGWGRLRADKWKRSIMLVLGQWDGWSVFSAEMQAFLVESFEAGFVEKEAEEVKEEVKEKETKKSRWKAVDTAAEAETLENTLVKDSLDKIDNEDGYRSDYTDDEALDAACMDEHDIDGEPMDYGVSGDRDAYLNGIPLTSDEIYALVGSDIAEMSEEGEIGSDDEEDYYMSLSEGESEVEAEAAGEAETETEVAKPDAVNAVEPIVPTESTIPTTDPTDPTETTDSQPSSRVAPPRKRMRAADMFADSE